MTGAAALVGTWRMRSWTRRSLSTDEVSDAMGADPIGYIAYHADGRMMAFVAKRGRPRPRGSSPAFDEKVELFDTMLADCASYTLENDRVIHHVEAAWNPAWQIDLVRPYVLGGDKLVIDGAAATDPVTGEAIVYSMEFRKV